jgi:hypothetical protein
MNTILSRDILNDITQFLNSDDLFFYIQTCRDFLESVNKNTYITIPRNSIIFSDVKYLEWMDDFKDFKINNYDTYKLGIAFGNCDVLDYIKYKIGSKYMSTDLYSFASMHKNSIGNLNWLKKNKCCYSPNTEYLSSFEIKLTSKEYKWIKEELIFNEDKFYNFIKNNRNDYESIEWILKSIPMLEEDFCEVAVSLNDINLLNWGIENNLPLSVHSCSRAASIGSLNLLEFLRHKKCPWNCWTTTEAASNGHMHILEWAYSRGCPLESYALIDALNNNHNDIIKWLLEHDCPIDDTVLYVSQSFSQRWFD